MTQYISTFLGGSSGVIGQIRLAHDAGVDITDEDGSYLLRSGSVASAASYPRAALLEHMKVSGIASTITTIATLQAATNGTGTIIVAYGSTSVLRSTDSGQTWGTVNVSGLGGSVASGVCWTGTHFIVVGNSATQTYAASSTTGASFLASVVSATYASATASSAKVVWCSGQSLAFVLVAAPAASGTMVTLDASGGSATSRTPSGTTTSAFAIVSSGSTVVYSLGASTSVYRTTDATLYLPSTLPTAVSKLSVAGGLILAFPSSGTALTYYTSPTGQTWTSRAFTGPAATTSTMTVTYDATRSYLCAADQPYAFYTTDGINWKSRGITGFPPAGSSWYLLSGLVALPTAAGTTAYRIPAWATADFVGIPSRISSSATGSDFPLIAYAKLS